MISRVLIQARMSSSRFPGKMLAPLRGLPVIAHVVARVGEAVSKDGIVVVTSDDATDDPLALYVQEMLGVAVFRGNLENVVRRFQDCLKVFPSEWFVRICGDSPVIDPALLASLLAHAERDGAAELVTNVRRRTFPPGQSVEVVRTASFLALNPDSLTADEREHLTLYFYRHPGQFIIRSFVATETDLAGRRLVVDTLDDLRHIEDVLAQQPDQMSGYANYLEKETE